MMGLMSLKEKQTRTLFLFLPCEDAATRQAKNKEVYSQTQNLLET